MKRKSNKPRSTKAGLISTFHSETKGRSVASVLLLLFSILGYGFEIGPGNEWLVSLAGKNTMDIVQSEGNLLLSGTAVGITLALTSLTEHLILGSAMHINIKRFPKTIAVIRDSKLGNSKFLRNSQKRNILEKFGNAFSVGAATVNLEDSVTDKDFIRKNKGSIRTVQSSLLVAFGSLIVGVLAGGSVQFAINSGNFRAANLVLDWIANPLLWAGLFILVRAHDYMSSNRQ